MAGTRRVALVARTVYGARNAFAVLAGALEGAGLLGSRVALRFVEGDPTPVALELERRGYQVAVLYGVSTPVFLELAGEIEEVASRFRVVAGGPHAEGAYWHLLRLGVYAAVVGDGEPAILGLVRHLAGESGLEDVPNIAYVEGGRFKVTRRIDADLDSFKPHSSAARLYPPIEIMRGCMYRCLFCQVPWLFKASVRFRSVGVVLRAVREYVATGRRDIRFVAPVGFAYMSPDMKTPNPDAIEELLAGVRRLGGRPYLGSFPSESRPEFVTDEVLDVVKRLAFNRKVAVGLQSGSDRLLDRVGRGHSVAEALEAVDRILRHGLTPVVDIIFGLPGEGDEDVDATVKVMEDLASRGARLRLHTFMPLPGTPLARSRPRRIHPQYRRAVRKLLGRGVLEGDWEEQEDLAARMYCLTAADPAPTREPYTLPGSEGLCRSLWSEWRRKPGLSRLVPLGARPH